MTTPRPTSKVDLTLRFGDPHQFGQPDPDVPFRMLIMGDFSGREAGQDCAEQRAPANRRPIRVDRDNVQDLLGKLNITLHSPLLGDSAPPITLKFAEIDDFHPDRLVHQVEPLKHLSDLRRRLADQTTFPQAADEIHSWAQPRQPTEAQSVYTESPHHKADVGDSPTSGLLDQMLEQAPTSVPDLRPTDWQLFLQSIVGPYSVPKEHPLAQELTAQVDAAMSQIMRTVLHHPEFQGLEAAWRGFSFVVDRLETDSQLQLYLLNLPKSELAADLLNRDDLQGTELYRLLVRETVCTPGAHPWAVVGGVYTFDRTTEDVEMLERIARVCTEAGAPFLAAASPKIVGCPSFGTTPDPDDWEVSATQKEDQERWERLRQIPEASYLGLSLPRFLLRLPYGQETQPISAFAFEEMLGVPKHENYCWGNPLFACLVLLGQAFSETGWEMNPGSIKDIEGLPLHVHQDDSGKSVTKPCAEAWLTEKTAERLIKEGLMPFVSYKDQDRIRLVRFQSLASPPTALMGRWDTA
jgi:type VI secretion system protein ImpC